MISLSALARDMEHLAPIPASIPRLAQAMATPDYDLQNIVTLIEYDPALTANTLRLANSAYFAPPVPVSTVREAVTRLGAGRILKQAVGMQLRGEMRRPQAGYDLSENELWLHSLAAAVAAGLLPRFAKMRVEPVTFTAALLHDIGKLLLSRHLDEEVRAQIKAIQHDRSGGYVDAERAVLGLDHAQVGALVARRWNFPEALCRAIAGHHDPHLVGKPDIVVDAVHICNAVAKIIGLGLGSEEMNMLAEEDSAQALGLSPHALESLCAATANELPNVILLFEEHAHGL